MKYNLQTSIDWCRIMKITCSQLFLAIIFTGISLANSSHAQSILTRQVDISANNMDLNIFLKKLEKAAGVKFVYFQNTIETVQKVTIDAHQEKLNNILTELLKPYNINFDVVNDHIVLSKGTVNQGSTPANNNSTKVEYSQTVPVNGKITDVNGEPLPGVVIKLKGTNIATNTDARGTYTINIPDYNGVLIFTYIGYATQEIALNGSKSINVQMVEEAKSLNEVVVVAYGTVKKKDLTGSVSIVDVDNAKKVATYDIAKMLQGQAAGVSVQSSGEPGSFVQIKIRGITSFGANNPLFVIDGVPVDGPFDFSPDNIESLQVLKDASSAALYGVRGAAGVVIITTKKGKAGPLKVNYNGYYGWQTIPKMLDVADRVGYQKVNNASQINAGIPLFPENDPANFNSSDPAKRKLFNDSVNTNWQKELYRTGMIQDHNVNLSGGSDAVTYNLGLGYFNQTSTLVGPQSYDRYSFNGSFQGKKGIFSFGGKTAYTQSDKNNLALTSDHAVFGGGVTNMLLAIPTMPVYDKSRLGGYGGSDDVISLNVIGLNALVTDKSSRNRMLGNLWAELELLKNLKLKTNLSYDRLDYRNYHYEPKFNMGFYYLNNDYILSDNRGSSVTAMSENTLTYLLQVGKHKIDFLAGQSYIQTNYDYLTATSKDTKDLNFITFTSIADPSVKGIVGSPLEQTTLSYLGRVNYNYDNRYYLTGNFRRDGSSNFGPSRKFGNFSSVGAAWNITNEKFIKLPSVISTLKLRGGYGVLGNQNIGAFGYYPYINNSASYDFNNTLAPGSTATHVADPTIHWETTTTYNAAIDLGLLQDKLYFTAEYFNRVTDGILLYLPIPASVGSQGGNVFTNAAGLKNSGIEFALTYKNNIGDFKYDISANANTLKNKVTKLGGTNNPIYGAGSKTEVGREVGELYGFVTEGIFQNAADVTAHATQVVGTTGPGDIKFKDTNGDGKITDDDRVYLGSVIPNLYYGFNLNASYKNFDVAFFIQGSAGNKVFNGVNQALLSSQYGNVSTEALNFWTPSNTNTNIPRPYHGDPQGNNRFSDRFIESGTYARLQNASIGYTIPKKVLDRSHAFSNVRIYVSGQNILTVSKYKGYDPDFINDGLFNRGFDYGSFPNPRTIMMGVQIGL